MNDSDILMIFRQTDFDLLPDGSPNPEWEKAWNFDIDPYDPERFSRVVAREYPEMYMGGMFIGAAFGLIGAAVAGVVGCVQAVVDMVRERRVQG